MNNLIFSTILLGLNLFNPVMANEEFDKKIKHYTEELARLEKYCSEPENKKNQSKCTGPHDDKSFKVTGYYISEYAKDKAILEELLDKNNKNASNEQLAAEIEKELRVIEQKFEKIEIDTVMKKASIEEFDVIKNDFLNYKELLDGLQVVGSNKKETFISKKDFQETFKGYPSLSEKDSFASDQVQNQLSFIKSFGNDYVPENIVFSKFKNFMQKIGTALNKKAQDKKNDEDKIAKENSLKEDLRNEAKRKESDAQEKINALADKKLKASPEYNTKKVCACRAVESFNQSKIKEEQKTGEIAGFVNKASLYKYAQQIIMVQKVGNYYSNKIGTTMENVKCSQGYNDFSWTTCLDGTPGDVLK